SRLQAWTTEFATIRRRGSCCWCSWLQIRTLAETSGATSISQPIISPSRDLAYQRIQWPKRSPLVTSGYKWLQLVTTGYNPICSSGECHATPDRQSKRFKSSSSHRLPGDRVACSERQFIIGFRVRQATLG